jgi:hypothetical protein
MDILLYLYSQAMAYIVPVVFMKEAMEVNELCIIRNFIKYFLENAATNLTMPGLKNEVNLLSACHITVSSGSL